MGMRMHNNETEQKIRDAKAADPALASALRANLLKRKAQLRGRETGSCSGGGVNEAGESTRSQSPPQKHEVEK